MLREASLTEMRRDKILKERRVLVNRGRGNDALAPAEPLFRDFSAAKKALEQTAGTGSAEAHNGAFLACDYERRFREQVMGDPEAMARLEEIARRGEREDVYLVCYEGAGKACHRRILLRIAETAFGARVAVDGVEPRPDGER